MSNVVCFVCVESVVFDPTHASKLCGVAASKFHKGMLAWLMYLLLFSTFHNFIVSVMGIRRWCKQGWDICLLAMSRFQILILVWMVTAACRVACKQFGTC